MNDWITIALLGKPRGNRGELLAAPLSDSPGRFESLAHVVLFREDSNLGDRDVERAWWHGDRLVLKFRGVDSISAAEELKGCEVRLPSSERATLRDGEFYRSDLLGCELVDAATGRRLGCVTGWEDTGAQSLIEIDGDWLVPFARGICKEVDLNGRRISVDLPEGLRELNRP